MNAKRVSTVTLAKVDLLRRVPRTEDVKMPRAAARGASLSGGHHG